MPTMKEATITLPNGTSIKVYPIGALARALNRSTCTIHRWESLGIIPETFFTNSRGHRMYSQEQIDIIVECAKEAGIKHGNSFALTPFTDLCYTRLSELKEKYMAHNN